MGGIAGQQQAPGAVRVGDPTVDAEARPPNDLGDDHPAGAESALVEDLLWMNSADGSSGASRSGATMRKMLPGSGATTVRPAFAQSKMTSSASASPRKRTSASVNDF